MADYDVAVIGAGIAGLNAAVTTARHGLKTIVVDGLGAGGQVINVDRIENFPGSAEGTAGYELGPMLQMQADEAGAEFVLDLIETIEKQGEDFVLTGSEGALSARAVIVAAGSQRRKLGVEGEDKFEGKGVSHCASCDGPIMRGKEVCVVGGGDSALDEALTLSAHVGKVTIIHRGSDLTARHSLIEKCRATDNIDFLLETEVDEIVGDVGVTHVRVRGSDGTTELPCHAIFVYIGLEPGAGFMGEMVDRDEEGRIVVDLAMKTSQPGIFAAGDIRTASVAHLTASAGDGVTAAISAVNMLAR